MLIKGDQNIKSFHKVLHTFCLNIVHKPSLRGTSNLSPQTQFPAEGDKAVHRRLTIPLFISRIIKAPRSFSGIA